MGGFVNDEYNYRTFHAAIQEKFPKINTNKGFDWAEIVYNAIISKGSNGSTNITGVQTERSKSYATEIKLRLLSVINPNTN